MDPLIWLSIAAALLLVAALVAVVVVRRRGMALPPVPDRTEIEQASAPTEDSSATAAALPGTVPEAVTTGLDVPEAPASRLVRLRRRLAGSQNALARGIADLLARDHIDAATWDDFETTLITSDLGVGPATELTTALRQRLAIDGIVDPVQAHAVLREELIKLVGPDMDRTVHTTAPSGPDDEDLPGVVLVVGVNGTGKTTTVGKLARVLVAEGKTVVLGAADTFRAAAADQLTTWGDRVGVETIRGAEGADPASVAYTAVSAGRDSGADVVLVDTAGRLHTKVPLMDELAKVKRVIEKAGAEVDETLLVLDATAGQNGIAQVRGFTDAVELTGVVLSKMDGSAKGGVILAVREELGVPVRFVGVGEGADDLRPFDAEAFADGLLRS